MSRLGEGEALARYHRVNLRPGAFDAYRKGRCGALFLRLGQRNVYLLENPHPLTGLVLHPLDRHFNIIRRLRGVELSSLWEMTELILCNLNWVVFHVFD